MVYACLRNEPFYIRGGHYSFVSQAFCGSQEKKCFHPEGKKNIVLTALGSEKTHTYYTLTTHKRNWAFYTKI